MTFNSSVNRLIDYAISKKMITEDDAIYCANKIIAMFFVQYFEREKCDEILPVNEILEMLCDFAYSKKIIENSVVYRDLFDTQIMDCFMQRPSDVIANFNTMYMHNPKSATDYFYKLSCDSNYIRTDRIAKNLVWKTDTKYGTLDITINLSKPEKDPKAIALSKNKPQTDYPKCPLCYENMGFCGSINKSARQNLRVIPMKLNNTDWFMQYSPYVYFNEHCIIFNKLHIPMKITSDTFAVLLDFVQKFPHYFLGSNADLPIMGGSILSHDHFQGGNQAFAIAKAKILKEFSLRDYPDVKISYLDWPLDVFRLSSISKEKILVASSKILNAWKIFSDETAEILAFSGDVPHNTITSVARKKGNMFELDLVLRNNRTNENFPLGIFHPDEKFHHIKKENIGIIEVMGLAVLPPRLKNELFEIEKVLTGENPISTLGNEDLVKHKKWCLDIMDKHSNITKDNVKSIMQNEVADTFVQILECCSVFKAGDKVKLAEKFIKSVR